MKKLLITLLALAGSCFGQITLIQPTDTVAASRTTINTNFTNLFNGGIAAPGSTTQIIYNNAGGLAGATGITTPDGANLTATSFTAPTFSTGSSGWTMNFSVQTVQLQSNVANTTTNMDIIPNGTGVGSNMSVWNSSNISSGAALRLFVNGTVADIRTSVLGGGTPITSLGIGENDTASSLGIINFQFNGITKASINNSGIINSVAGFGFNGTPGFTGNTAINGSGCILAMNGGIATDITGCALPGSNTDLLFNNSGAMGATAGLTTDGTNLTSTGVITAAGLIATVAAPTVSAAQVGFGSTVTASSSCGSLSSAAGCLVINVAGTTRYVPYY